MIKINDSNPVKGYSNIKKKLGGGGGSSTAFSDILSAAGQSGGTAATSAASSTANVGGLLALQEVSDEEMARKKTIQQGHSLIQSLDALRQSLLMGAIPPSVLRSLESRLQNQRAQTIDPELHAIMDDIELRAAVELAKFERTQR